MGSNVVFAVGALVGIVVKVFEGILEGILEGDAEVFTLGEMDGWLV